MEEIFKKVSEFFVADESEFWGYCRKAEVCDARHMMWYVLHYEFGISSNQISKKFKRNIRTIKRGISRIKYMIEYYPEFRKQYQEISKKIPRQNPDEGKEKI